MFTTTAMHMQHPRNYHDRWRDDGAKMNRLVEEIDRLLEPQSRPPT